MTREEAYIGGQKLQTYISITDPHDLLVKVAKDTKIVSYQLDEIVNLEPEAAPVNGFTANLLELDANSIL